MEREKDGKTGNIEDTLILTAYHEGYFNPNQFAQDHSEPKEKTNEK